VNSKHWNNDSTVTFNINGSDKPAVRIQCYYDFVLDKEPKPQIFSPPNSLLASRTRDPTTNYFILEYDVPDSEKNDRHTYGCGTRSNYQYVVITLVYANCEYISSGV
jgi:hypothetical protein